MATENWPKTLQQAIVYFSNPDRAFTEAVKSRWPDGVVKCKAVHQRRQFSVKIGSIMEDSPLGIDKWLIAIWLIDNAKNGISSYELAKAIGITQKSAWFMLHRIRLAMQDETGGKLGGHVEVDETYIG